MSFDDLTKEVYRAIKVLGEDKGWWQNYTDIEQWLKDGLISKEQSVELRNLNWQLTHDAELKSAPVQTRPSALFYSTSDMEDGYVEKIAVLLEENGYHNHFLYDEDKGKGAAGTGPFATLEDAKQDVMAHRPDAIEMVETNIGTIPAEDYREIIAGQAGFDSYAEMRKAGWKMGNQYDVEPEETDFELE